MPVRVRCPHCHTPCLVAEQHQGVPVKCGRCGGTFTTRAHARTTMRIQAPASRLRLDIGAAASPHLGGADTFLVQHLVYCHLEERHELAVLVAADSSGAISAATAVLAPLLGTFLDGASTDVAAVCKNLSSTVAIALIRDGRVSMSGLGAGSIYHQSSGRLNRLKGDPLQLAAGDWLLLAYKDLPPSLDAAALQTEITASRCSASELAQRLIERAGPDACTIIAVRGS